MCSVNALPVSIDRVYSMADMEEGVMLNGPWHFYWEQTYSPLLAPESTTPRVNVPGEWNELGYPAKGYGVIQRTIVTKGLKGYRLGLYVPSVCNNYNLYINGKKVASAGVFSTSAATAKPAYDPKIVEFLSTSDTLKIAFEVSNFFYREGGINYNIHIGLESTIEKNYSRQLMIQSFSSGALFIMALYFLCIFFIRKGDSVPLYFGLLCFVSCVRIFSTETILWHQFNIPISWDFLIKVEITSIMLMPTFGILYLSALVEEKKFKAITYTINALTIVGCCFVFFNSTYRASFIVPPFRYFVTMQLVYLLFIMYRAAFVTKHPLGRLAAIGYMMVFIVGLNDIIYSAGLINTFYAIPITVFVYVIIQAVVLAKKSAIAFGEVELLTLQLGEVNRNQEKIIENRTKELNIKTGELEQYNSVKDKVFAIIGHDLRAPIATLSSVLTLAEQADDNTLTELRTYFKGIKRSVDNLNLTIENLLVWSQSQINGVKLNKQQVNLNNEVESVIALYGLTALQKEIVLMHRITSTYTLHVDPAHLNLILRNVISNSLKFTNIGGSIVISASQPAPGKIQICIKDNGIGIQPERIDQILNPVSHYSTHGTLNEKGTGLGLMLCREYAEANGGSISIESSTGMGTKVCIILPAS
jgi:signal transduction histidine kinase